MNLNINQNASLGSKARRFTRRLSYGISKVLRDWNSDSNDVTANSKYALYEENSKVFDIEDLIKLTKFSKAEIQFIYRDFKIKCPDGILTDRALAEIYSQIFSCGDTQLFSKHLFSAMIQQVAYTSPGNPYRSKNEINFKEFLIALSSIMRGTMDDRIRWLFYFYDVNKDGKITQDEIESMIRSLYDLMGQNVNPPVDEATKAEHIHSVIQRLGLHLKGNVTITYNEFYQLFSNNQDLIEKMMNVY